MNEPFKDLPETGANRRILNEIGSKVINEASSDSVTESREDNKTSDYSEMLFTCECDATNCPEPIYMSTQEYAHIHQKNMYFMVIPGHVHLDIEEIITRFANYCVVKKLFPHSRLSRVAA